MSGRGLVSVQGWCSGSTGGIGWSSVEGCPSRAVLVHTFRLHWVWISLIYIVHHLKLDQAGYFFAKSNLPEHMYNQRLDQSNPS